MKRVWLYKKKKGYWKKQWEIISTYLLVDVR